MKRLGIDIGSTTIKCVVLSDAGEVLYSSYDRHRAKIAERMTDLLHEVAGRFPEEEFLLGVSGSAGMGIANDLGLPFVQEVWATRIAVRRLAPETSVVIELGGEDAKILFLDGAMEVRMNGSCAGGTGAFIDQMATLMGITPDEMNTLARGSERTYTIASRCGVFAKSDVQPLLNQGARREDVAASIFLAVVNQTIAGLAQGREIKGNILYLGGPLTFLSGLREAFDRTLGVHGVLPENSLYFVALGAAMAKTAQRVLPEELAKKTEGYTSKRGYLGCDPLFRDEAELEAFRRRHDGDTGNTRMTDTPVGALSLGIDAGSTTVKAVLVDEEGNLFRPLYTSNSGNPVPILRQYLTDLYRDCPDIRITSSCVTGYGEQLIRAAFGVDMGLVETVAHYTAAERFCPDVDFIIDIGGQDIKCFQIRDGAIDSIYLNEACSSGCGSFLQTFSAVLGDTPAQFSERALRADAPVDLGSRCTVFMNSSVKQAQKDGASVENIAAGLAISVVKNALYKVIRCADPKRLGEHIVVQGGTFLSDAVLRAFERETGRCCLRPKVAGLMGAYGAALWAQRHAPAASTLIDPSGLAAFTHDVKAITCNGCENHCRLTVNTFGSGAKYIAGNRCEKPVRGKAASEAFDLYAYKLSLLAAYRNDPEDDRPAVGIPMGLNLYELLPFWYTLFHSLGYRVIVSETSSHALYVRGQHTIPSDTVCYPAKLMHGHMESLIEKGAKLIFYPSMSYNLDEGHGKNHYNCPVVAYYPKVLGANVHFPRDVKYVSGFVGLHNRRAFPRLFVRMMRENGIALDPKAVERAADLAYAEYISYMKRVHDEGQRYLAVARERGLPVVVLAGRPYHIDPEINHGIPRLICDLGAVVVSEDALASDVPFFETTVLNQWTYHARLYAAAKRVAEEREQPMGLVQLVPFGCGVDAITTDEVRAILESAGQLYTQIKIDEITNLGAVKIRLRSLFAVMSERDKCEKRRTSAQSK